MLETARSFSITFCGGCNEAYDRAAFVRELLAEINQLPTAPRLMPRDEEADIALLVCGCHALCIAEREDCGKAREQRHILGPDSLDYLPLSHPEAREKILQHFKQQSSTGGGQAVSTMTR